MLYQIIAAIHSLWVCHGTHDWTTITFFRSDEDGPELRPLFPGGPMRRCRKVTYEHCRRCGLRSDGGYDE